jgi:hypothetical protein
LNQITLLLSILLHVSFGISGISAGLRRILGFHSGETWHQPFHQAFTRCRNLFTDATSYGYGSGAARNRLDGQAMLLRDHADLRGCDFS